MSPVRESRLFALIASLKIGAPASRGPFQLWPLLLGAVAHPRPDDAQSPRGASPAAHALAPRESEATGWVPLARALEDGMASVECVSTGGGVRVGNRGPDPVLILRGDDLSGAGRNCSAHASRLVPPRSSLPLEVSRQLRAGSTLGLPPVARQVGAVTARHGRIVGLEVVDCPASFTLLAAPLLRACGALPVAPSTAAPGPALADPAAFLHDPAAFLHELAAAEAREDRSPGLGRDLWLSSDHAAARALLGPGIAHLSAHPRAGS